MTRYAKLYGYLRNQFSGGGRGGCRERGRGGCDRGGFGGRGGGRRGGGATAGWLRREMEAAKTELYSCGYGAESSWNSVRESGESDGGWAKNMTVGGSIQSHTNIINSEESWD